MAKSATATATATTPAPTRSAWFAELIGAFEAAESCSFLLHTGIADYERPGVGVAEYLARALSGPFEVVVLYSVSKGVYWPTLRDKAGNPLPTKAMRERFFKIVGQEDSEPDQPAIMMAPEPATALLLDFLRKAPAQTACVILERIDNMVGDIVPVDPGVISLMEMIHDAGTDKALEAHGNPLIMMTPSLEEIRPQVRRASSGIKTIEVPLPDQPARLDFAKQRLDQEDMAEVKLVGITVEQLAALTAGLLRRHIENIMLRARANGGNLTRQLALLAQRELMDVEYAGIVKRIDKPFRMSDFGGSPEAVAYMNKRVVGAMRRPSSILFVGPPGTGKTLLATATANESGLNCLEVDLAQLMGGIVGETEKNVARFKQAVVANAPTIVFMDEIDQKARRGEGGPDSGGGGAVENRLFAAILELTSDPALRDKGVTFIFASNRPDLLDAAFLSRMQAIIPLLPADTDEARADVLSRILVRLRGGSMDAELVSQMMPFAAQVKDWSGRDLEQVIDESLATVELDGVSMVEALTETIKYRRADTSKAPKQVQEALKACKDLRLVPERYRAQVGQAQTTKPEWGGSPTTEGDSGKKLRKLTWGND